MLSLIRCVNELHCALMSVEPTTDASIAEMRSQELSFLRKYANPEAPTVAELQTAAMHLFSYGRPAEKVRGAHAAQICAGSMLSATCVATQPVQQPNLRVEALSLRRLLTLSGPIACSPVLEPSTRGAERSVTAAALEGLGARARGAAPQRHRSGAAHA